MDLLAPLGVPWLASHLDATDLPLWAVTCIRGRVVANAASQSSLRELSGTVGSGAVRGAWLTGAEGKASPAPPYNLPSGPAFKLEQSVLGGFEGRRLTVRERDSSWDGGNVSDNDLLRGTGEGAIAGLLSCVHKRNRH